jgi:hypothetical protein
MSTEIVRLATDEFYPCHEIVGPDNRGTDCEVPTEKVKQWIRVTKEFYAIQKEMEDALDNARR